MGKRVQIRRSQYVAIAMAIVLLVGSGVGHRLLAARYARLAESREIPPGTLSRLPLSLGDWSGQEAPLDPAIIKATDTDDHLSRIYTRSSDGERISLWVAYGVRFRDLAPHRPEVCYTGVGWILEGEERSEVATPSGESLACRILTFRRSGLEGGRAMVLNYYLVDGQAAADVGLLRSYAWQLDYAARYVAQVQIVCTDSGRGMPAREVLSDFAAVSAPGIRGLLEDAVNGLPADKTAGTK
jgi:EpsI family protein